MTPTPTPTARPWLTLLLVSASIAALCAQHVALAVCTNDTFVTFGSVGGCASANGASCTSGNTACIGNPGQQCYDGECVTTTYNSSCVDGGCASSDFVCMNGYCLLAQAYTNDPCTQNAECVSQNCTNFRCVPQMTNQFCSVDGECQLFDACLGGSCSSRNSEGQSCSSTTGSGIVNTCERGFECLNGQCVRWFSQPTGAQVIAYTTPTSILCQSGIANADGFCVSPDNSLQGQQCTSNQAGYTCTCTSYEGSMSGTGVLIGQDPSITSAVQDFASCALRSNCYLPPGLLGNIAPYSCLTYNCGKPLAVMQCASTLQMQTSTIMYMNLPSCFENWAKSVADSLSQCMEWSYSCTPFPGNSPQCM